MNRSFDKTHSFNQIIINDSSTLNQEYYREEQKKEAINESRMLATADPCLEYFDLDTKQLCKTCDNSVFQYELFIISPKIVHCAVLDSSKKVCEITDITLYANVEPNVKTLLTYFKVNEQDYGDIVFHSSDTYLKKGLCINQKLYYTRAPLYQQPYPTDCEYKDLTFKDVDDTDNSDDFALYCAYLEVDEELDPPILNTIAYLSKYLQCFECHNMYLKAEINTRQQFRYWAEYGIYVTDCLPVLKPGATEDVCGVPLDQTANLNCYANQYLKQTDPIDPTKLQCVDCSEDFGQDCAACDETGCKMCRQGFFLSDGGYYNYVENGSKEVEKRRAECVFDNCPVGQCRDFELNICTKASNSMEKCLRCYNTDAENQKCEMCSNGYIPSSDGKSCEAIQNTIVTQNLFVTSINTLHIKPNCMPNATTIFKSQVSNGDVDFGAGKINSSDITKASPFLYHAWNSALDFGKKNIKVTATIYLSRGRHFLFNCAPNKQSSFDSTNYTCLYNYCNALDLKMYYSSNDNIDITIMPLECDLEKSFNFSGQALTSFKAMCVNYAMHGKPTIYVNNPTTYFNVSGKLTVKNLLFSGINALPVYNDTQMDFSILPNLLCIMPNEPNGLLDPNFINGTKNSNSQLVTYLKYDLKLKGFAYNCSFYNSTDQVPKKPPNKWGQNQTCLMYNPKIGNNAQTFDNKFLQYSQSTKSCKGEPYSDDYFQFGNNIYYNRKRTLFNIYSFPEHLTIRNQTPELIIENSQFEYFLHKDYESLINIESQTINKAVFKEQQYYFGAKGDDTSDRVYYVFNVNGADRGVKLTITNSIFKHSRFCKGMIVYRPSYYIPNNEYFRTFINQTNLFMNHTLKNNTDSFIIMKGSSFINMNAYTQVISIAKSSVDYNKILYQSDYFFDSFFGPLFLNKGIVLNVEDFGGRIEIVGCIFDKNFHYIPSILYNGESQNDQQLDSFFDTEKDELFFTICNNKKDAHFFGSSQLMTMLGAQENKETDFLFNDYEKLGLIYVARNLDLILIKGSKFTQNIGFFGGAITIDSPNWIEGNQPHVVLHSNTFDKNMAYFSGNAVYIRPTMQFESYYDRKGIQCAGVNIISNLFTNNMGLKVHNGGAVSVVCSYPDYLDINYDRSSGYSDFLVQNSSSVFNNATYMTVTSQTDGQLLGIQKASLNIQGNQFTNNYSGRKGTAVYIIQMTRVRLYDNTFYGNGPVYAMAENLYSVYQKFFSGRTMSFTDPDCSDEFHFLQSCYNIKPVDDIQYAGLQWPIIQGTVYIQYCSDYLCLNPNQTQEFNAAYNTFQQNFAGPVLNAAQTQTASQIFIQNGKNITISHCLFTENRGFKYYFDQQEERKLTKYFPNNYIENSHSPLINWQIALPMDALNDINITLTIKNCQFMKNKNIQVLGLGNNLQYQGSLININNQQNYLPKFNQLVTFILQDCTIRDNYFVGANSALIYSSKIISKIIRNQFLNNGHFYQATPKWVSQNSNRKKFVTSLIFPFKDISHYDYQQNGCIWLSSSIGFPFFSIHEVINNTFSYLFAYQGSAYTFTAMDQQDVLLQGNKYSMLIAMRGPVLYWTGNKENATVKLNKEIFDMIFAGKEGAISINPTTIHQNQILIYNSNFSNVYAEEGSVLFLRNIGKFIVDNCIFNQTKSFQNSSEQIQFFKNNFKMTQYNSLSNFIDELFLINIFTLHKPKTGYIDVQGVYKDLLKDNGDDSDPIMFQGQLVQALNNSEFTYSVIQNSQLLNNNADQQAVMYADVSKIKVKNTKIAFNKVSDYGIIGHEGLSPSEIIIENVQFLNNTSKTRCSGFFVGQSKASLTNASFIGNKAFVSGTIYIENDALFTCQNCTFQENWADDGSAFYIQNNANSVSKIQNSLLINNRAGTNVMNIQYSSIEIYNTTFQDNIAQEVNHGLTLIGSKAKIENVTVNYQNKDFLNSTPSNVDSGFFNLNYRSAVTISSSLLRNCRGSIAAVFIITGGSSLNVDRNTTFTNCSSVTGDVLHASSAKLIQVSNAVFQDNGVSSDIYMEQSLSIIKDSKFINSKFNSISVWSSSIQLIGNLFFDTKLSVKDIRTSMSPSNITQITSFIGQQGKGLYCKCNSQSLIANNTFRGLSAEMGAAIFLSSETPVNNPLFSIKNNVFDSNYAVNGAGIYLENGNIVMKNNTMMFNRGDSGGAIYLSCLDTALNNTLPLVIDGVNTNDSMVFQQKSDGTPKKCNVLITQGNILVNNTGRDGGAIKWTKDRPVIDLNTTKFVNNTATVYGNDIASFPKAVQLVFLSNRDYLNAFNQSADNATLNSSGSSQQQNQTTNPQLKMLQSNSTPYTSSNLKDPTEKIGYIPPLVSGNKLDFNVYILDQDGNIYKSDSKSKATLDSAGSNSGNKSTSNGTLSIQEVILLNNAVIAQEGVYQFRGVELRADPGSSPSLNLGFAGLQTFGNPMSFAQAPVKINTTVRKCVLGEELTVDGRCVPCLEGWYQFKSPDVPVSCKKCPIDADCKGKMTVYPKPGNWRSSNTSENFMQCPNSKVCLGGDANNPQGKCATGYQGFLCGDCAPNYSKTKDFTCGKCPPRIRNIVQTSFIIVALAGYIAFLVRGTLISASEKKSTISAYMKILTNHMQILSAIGGIEYQWPSQIQKFQQSQSQVTSASGQIFSFDCFLMGKDETDNGIMPIFFQKLIMQALQPIIFLLVCIAFWSTVAKLKNYSGAEYRAKLISTMIVILFMVHPDIADIMFSSFNCVKVDDKYRMTQNIRSVCYQGEHLFYMSVVAFPSIGVWVMGIPLLAFIVLRRNKRVIDLMGKKEITKAESEEIFQLKTKYGFLFSGYDARAYFWEVIIMYRKILVIASSVFLSSVSPESQVLVVIFIIVCNMFLHIHMNPYSTPILNKMESYSLQVAAVTIYTGMYYVTGKYYDYMKIDGVSWFFLICIVLPNLVFLVYWAFYMRIEVLKSIYKICKDKNLNPLIFKVLAFTSAENFYENYIKKEEEFEQETKQIIIDGDSEIVKVDDVVIEVTAVNQDETASNMLIDGYTKDDDVQPQAKEKKSKHKRKSRYEEDWAKLNSGMVSSRSYKVHPDTHREIIRDEFYDIKGYTNNEGPTDGLQFTLNDEGQDHKKGKRRRHKQKEETSDFNKLHQFIDDQDGGKQSELMVIENDSFSLGEIEIEPDEVQSSPLQITPHDDHSARKQLIHHLASKSSPNFPNNSTHDDQDSPSRKSPRKQSQPRNEKQHKSSHRLRSESKDPHHRHKIEVSPQERAKSKDKKDKKDKKEKKSKKDKEKRHSRHRDGGDEKRKKSHSKRTKKEDRKE